MKWRDFICYTEKRYIASIAKILLRITCLIHHINVKDVTLKLFYVHVVKELDVQDVVGKWNQQEMNQHCISKCIFKMSVWF